MTTPVPDSPFVDTPYGRRGPYWSCDRDAHGNGIHTGADFGAAVGTRVVAARPGQLVHCDHGSAFGNHQVEVRCDDGTRDFYAHMSKRAGEGRVEAGDKIGEVGAEGNVTGPHLHFERHATTAGGWSCAVVRDPTPSIQWEDDSMTPDDWTKLRGIVKDECERAWSTHMTVTQPGSGKDTTKQRQQVLRELWQKVTKAT
jgi:murein DD-endopeptidase MepM/ murein hydrolase activator NlpD